MSRIFDHMRGHVYPRSRIAGSSESLHASNVILGMLSVMLAVLAVAHAITLASTAF
ncbi:hypothetical protein [Neorhizobium sp. DT-125]|uniref:hypothetical protein n=1 Tax=Neorhizobium sp. DT-125 TaxID=3396163 RepID=UPI003F1CA54B